MGKQFCIAIKKAGDNIANYLITHYKGTYRIKVPYDIKTHQFPRKIDGTYEDIDCYIDCQYGNKIYHYGHNILQAYIPSIIRGHNIIKYINENLGQDIIFDIEETDEEIIFKFNSKYDEKIIPLRKPKTSEASISPFSSKNLPRNKDYKIPYVELSQYKNIVAKIPPERILTITHTTNNFIKSLVSKNNTLENIKADMKLKGLKGKEYIHSIGKWNDFIEYLEKNIKKG